MHMSWTWKWQGLGMAGLYARSQHEDMARWVDGILAGSRGIARTRDEGGRLGCGQTEWQDVTGPCLHDVKPGLGAHVTLQLQASRHMLNLIDGDDAIGPAMHMQALVMNLLDWLYRSAASARFLNHQRCTHLPLPTATCLEWVRQ